ncbi:MAG: hypothetical protein M3389_14220 [Actinomycetota bacterium]|nr:hypothetical protein [Actinomycetota bacterium]
MTEVLELEARGKADEPWAALMEPMVSRIRRAVEMAPQEADLQFLAAVSLYAFAKVDCDAKDLLKTCAARVEQLGGPSDFATAQIGGPAEVERRMALVRSVTGTGGGGCLLALAAVLGLAMSCSAGVRGASWSPALLPRRRTRSWT